MSPEEMRLDMLVAELDYENRLLRARNERLEREAEQRLQKQEPVAVTDNTYNYAKSLAEAIFKQHFASDEHYASGQVVWGVNDTVIGILTQIDNMVADMVRRPAQQQEPVATVIQFDGEKIIDASMEFFDKYPIGTELYTSPPASKPWVGLTDQEIRDWWRIENGLEDCNLSQLQDFTLAVRAIELKLREKNQ